jgi:hypothetical protein
MTMESPTKIAANHEGGWQRATMMTDHNGRTIGMEMREISGRIMGIVLRPTSRSPSTSWKSWAWMVVMMTKKKIVSSGKFFQ